jgi:NADH dehydrogenase [ubiquinone] 1 alpha subcomplex assembly factor 7
MGRPPRFALMELGPGRGTLMADALRALRILPECRDALSVHLVETSPVLRGAQRAMLAACGVTATWHATIEDIPAGPAIILANEFLDALPVRQFVRTETGWHERMVGLAEDRLAFGLFAEPEPNLALAGHPGDLVEVAESALGVTRRIAGRLAAQGGAALFIDYGHALSGMGETLQAVRRHAFVDPLAEPGEADLTAHVDFAAIGRVAQAAGARVHGPVTQGAFLNALGIGARAAALYRNATPDGRAAIEAALARLTGTGERQMGALFKVLGLSHPVLALPALPAAEPQAAKDPARC